MPLEGTSELLDLRTPNSRVPALGLDIDDVEAKAILVGDPR
jgi:hypothetical protein